MCVCVCVCVCVCGEGGHTADTPEHTSPQFEFYSYNYVTNHEQVASNRSAAVLRHMLLPFSFFSKVTPNKLIRNHYYHYYYYYRVGFLTACPQ